MRYLMGLSCQDNWSSNRETNRIGRARDEWGSLSSVLVSAMMRVKKDEGKNKKKIKMLLILEAIITGDKEIETLKKDGKISKGMK